MKVGDNVKVRIPKNFKFLIKENGEVCVGEVDTYSSNIKLGVSVRFKSGHMLCFGKDEVELEHNFKTAWKLLLEGKIISSKLTGCRYKIDKSDIEKIKLRVYNPVFDSWSECEHISVKEIFDKWYIASLKNKILRGQYMELVDCNKCKHINIREEQQIDKNINHMCNKYKKRVFHYFTVPTKKEHPKNIYPCTLCTYDDYEYYEKI